MFLQFNNRGGFRPMGPAASGPMSGLHAGGFSFDDGGMDEYDVADERVHLFEYINPDNMTYEEIIALQDRMGYVNKGLTLAQINSFPKMQRKDVLAYQKKLLKGEKLEEDMALIDLSEIDIRNPMHMVEESKLASKKKNLREDDFDEVIDGDEGIINRRLPLNSYNHQL